MSVPARHDPEPWAPARSGPDADPEPQRAARAAMVRDQIEARGVRDGRVLAALRAIPRHLFLGADQAGLACADRPLPIGAGQTISQPFIVAAMAEALGLTGAERVLEVGSGSGYMAAVLATLARAVYGLELEPDLHRQAAQRLARLGCPNVHLRCGDGALGWPERAPFDAIVLSCASPDIPAELWRQLADQGRMLLPLGAVDQIQELVLVRKAPQGSQEPAVRHLMPVSFVPLRRAPGSPPARP